MFPASAGMNRVWYTTYTHPCYVPRERGDEPVVMTITGTVRICSPRARG